MIGSVHIVSDGPDSLSNKLFWIGRFSRSMVRVMFLTSLVMNFLAFRVLAALVMLLV